MRIGVADIMHFVLYVGYATIMYFEHCVADVEDELGLRCYRSGRKSRNYHNNICYVDSVLTL